MMRRSVIAKLAIARLVIVRLAGAVLAAAALLAPASVAQTSELRFPPGSRLGMIAPAAMSASTSFPGFEDVRNNAFVRLIELPEEAHAEIEKTLTADALKKQGMIVEKRQPLDVAGEKATLLTVRQETPAGVIRKWLMIGRLPGRTAMVSFELPVDSDAYSDDEVRKALASIGTRDSIPEAEQLSLVPFKIGDLAGFRIVSVAPGRGLQLTDGAGDVPEPINQPHLIVSLAAGGPPRPQERDSFARLALGGLPPIKEMRITGSEPIRIGGQQGHEIRAEGRDAKTGAEIGIVQWLRFGGGAYIRYVGFAPKEDWLKSFQRFRTVRDAIEPR